MGARGRGANRTLAAVPGGDVVSIPRAKPPDELTPEQKVIWHSIVNKLPADHFPAETHLILAEYCRHAVTARRIAHLKNQIENAESLNMEEYALLCKLAEAESRTLASLGTKMRMTQQSTYSARKGRGEPLGPKPWEDSE
ncbi:MAG: hypothetical protein NPIRA03_06730 [Nitrospirales bacterium]|nr:MAG: hypothetical protein NPIRA03_06730 [Nitrospirales bacterium]